MKKIEYARNRSTGRNWAYHKKEEMYLKKLEMKQSMTEFLNRVKKVETPPLHFIYSNEVEEGSEKVRMKLAERYEDHSYLFNYGAVINDDDIIEMERRKNFSQKRPHTRSSTLKSDNSNNELNSKINLYFLHQNCGNCIRLRVNGTLVPEYFVRRSAFPNPPSSSSSSSVSTPATKAATTSLHHSLPSFYITPPSSSSSTPTPTSCFPSSSFPSYSSIPSLTLNSSSMNPITSSSSSSTTTTTTSSLSSSSSSSSSSTSSLEKRKRRQSSRINKNINLKYEDEDDNDNSFDANTDHDDHFLKNSCSNDDDIQLDDYTTQKDNINNNDNNNTDSDKLDDIKKNQNVVNSDTNDSSSHQSRSKKKNTKAAVNANKVETKGSKRGGFLLESCWALCTLRHRANMHFSFLLHYTVLHCIVLYCVVLYCIVLCCVVPYCIVLYRTNVHEALFSTFPPFPVFSDNFHPPLLNFSAPYLDY